MTACSCIAEMNKLLAEHNAQVACTLLGDQKAVVSTVKLHSRKRGRVPYVLASFCPFCGERYPGAGSLKPAAAGGVSIRAEGAHG